MNITFLMSRGREFYSSAFSQEKQRGGGGEQFHFAGATHSATVQVRSRQKPGLAQNPEGSRRE